MKPSWMICCVLLVCLMGTGIQVQAAPILTLGSTTVVPGGTTTLNLSLAGGTEAYAGVNVTINLPNGVTLTGVTRGALLSTSFATDYYFHDADNWGSVIAYSGNSTVSAAGVLLTLNLAVASNVAAGTYPLTITASGLSNADGSISVTHTANAGTLIVSSNNTGQNFLLWTK